MKPLVALISLLVLTVGTFFLWSARLPPFDGLPEPVEVSIDELTVAQDGVRVSGTAHYSVKQSLVRPARFGRPEATWYLFPIFPRGETGSTLIRAMVLSPNQPDRLVGLEDMTVEGWARHPKSFMSPDAEANLRSGGYSFAEEYVLIEMFPPESE